MCRGRGCSLGAVGEVEVLIREMDGRSARWMVDDGTGFVYPVVCVPVLVREGGRTAMMRLP